MNKKLFFAGFALLAAVSFTSCNSDNPIDVTDPNGVRPVNSAHYLGGSYDWTAVVKDYAQLQEFWAADKDAVKKALEDSKANTVNILLDVSGYELKNEVIKLPDFWQDGKTNGKVVNITFQGNFKNADFERAHAIDKVDNVAKMSKFPVKIDANTLVSSEVNFTFNVEKFDLVIETREARSTFSGDYTIGYMMAKADVKDNDALEVKEGTVEGVDLQSTGKFKGAFGGIWTRNNENFTVAANGIKTTSGSVIPGSKNVYLEKDAVVDTWYEPNAKTNLQYKLGTVKFVQKAGSWAWLELGGTNNNGLVAEDAIENIVGFNKALCYVYTNGKENALKNIDSMEKVRIYDGGTAVSLKKDIFSDVDFNGAAKYNTKDIDTFADVTFNNLTVTVHADNQTLTYNGVNFKTKVILKSGIKETEQTGYNEKLYQWIIDNTITLAGHFELVDDDHPVLDANKDKAVVVFADTDIQYDGATTFVKVKGSDAQLAEATSSYLVLITHTDTDDTTYIPDGTSVLLNSCKFKEPTTGNMNTTNTALNNIWGNNVLWDEQCWYTVYVDGTKYNWRKSAAAGTISTVKYVLYPAATAE